MCSLTYQREKVKQELFLLKFGALYHQLPKSLDLLEISLPTSITTLADSVLRQRLSNEYQRIIQRAKCDLIKVETIATEAKKNECEKKYGKEIGQIWKDQRQYPMHERITRKMLDIIERRQKNITECLKLIYKLKDEFCLRAPPRTLTIMH